MSSHTHTHTSLLVIFPTWPSTHPLDGHSVRSRKYRTTYTGHVRIFVFGRDHVWIKWRHGTPAGADIHRFYVVWLFLLFRQLVARSLARGREKAWRVCVCVSAYTWRGNVVYLGCVSRYAPLSCIGTSRVALTSVETELNWKFYSWMLDGSPFFLLFFWLVRGINRINWSFEKI